MNYITKIGQDQESEVSPFDSIRRFDQDGNEFWMATELLTMLDSRSLYPGLPEWNHRNSVMFAGKSMLNASDAGLLILEFAALVLTIPVHTSYEDAYYLWQCAHSIYKGSSATFIFHSVFAQIIQTNKTRSSEFYLYSFIDSHWKALFPRANRIEKQFRINRKKYCRLLG